VISPQEIHAANEREAAIKAAAALLGKAWPLRVYPITDQQRDPWRYEEMLRADDVIRIEHNAKPKFKGNE
jgi:hypothetical protein